MPELPEVETIARELDARVAGRTIRSVQVLRPDVLREATPEHLWEACREARILRVWRRGKTAVISLAGERHLLVQPRFTGALLVVPADGDAAPSDGGPPPPDLTLHHPAGDPFAAVVWTLDGDGFLWYRDVRRLGTVTLMNDEGLARYDERIGPEPLDPAFDAARLSGLLRGSRSAIKKVLMDQRVVAGVGNIYANEALWRSGIDPSRAACSLERPEVDALHDALVSVLASSIQARGTTFRDYRDPANRAGGFAAQLQAYGRGGLPCARCGTRLTETHAIDGRSTVFCHRCQR